MSGLQPDVFTALRTFQPITGTGDQPAVTPQLIGNSDLKPERGQELEVGFEGEAFNRLSLDFTYFSKTTKDAILLRPVPPSSGFPGNQYVNIGEVSNHGLELRATLQALSAKTSAGKSRGTSARPTDKIEDLGGIPFVAFAGIPQRHVEGLSDRRHVGEARHQRDARCGHGSRDRTFCATAVRRHSRCRAQRHQSCSSGPSRRR